MKSLMITIAALFATSAFAGQGLEAFMGDYDSRGTWKDVSGMENTWTSTMTLSRVETDDDSLVLRFHEVLSLQTEDETVEMDDTIEFHHRDNFFFDVYIEGMDVGEGYCYGRHCHYNYLKDGEKMEETLLFSDDNRNIIRTGSGMVEDAFFAWRGISTRR